MEEQKRNKIFSERMRENPWIIATFVLALALIVMTIFSSGSITGNAILSEQTIIPVEEISQQILTFMESNPDIANDIDLISSSRNGYLYEILYNYQGQEIPVYVTVDGKYLVSGVIPFQDLGAPVEQDVPVEQGNGLS